MQKIYTSDMPAPTFSRILAIAVLTFGLAVGPPTAEATDSGSEAPQETTETTSGRSFDAPVTGIARLGGGFRQVQNMTLGVSFGRLATRFGFGRGSEDPLVLSAKLGYRMPLFDTRADGGRGFTFAVPILASTYTSVNGDVYRVVVGPELELDLRYWLSEQVGLNASATIGVGQPFGYEYGATILGYGPGQDPPTATDTFDAGIAQPTGGFEIGILF